jgi:hypothetical protein
MAEPTPEKQSKQPKFEDSPNLSGIVAATIEATKRIGAVIKNFVGMFFK